MDQVEYDRLAAFYRDRVATLNAARPGYQLAWDALTQQVLEHGGQLVVPPLTHDPHLETLSDRLTVWPGQGALLREGEPNRCHSNSVSLWLNEEVDALATGYALSDDGLWRQHTWAFGADDAIVETTEVRMTYAGVRLENAAALVFAAANVGEAEFTAALAVNGKVAALARDLLAHTATVGSQDAGT